MKIELEKVQTFETVANEASIFYEQSEPCLSEGSIAKRERRAMTESRRQASKIGPAPQAFST